MFILYESLGVTTLRFLTPAALILAALAASREMSVVHIDTRLDVNSTGLRTPREVESPITRMDVVLTTRLHATGLSIKNGVPQWWSIRLREEPRC